MVSVHFLLDPTADRGNEKPGFFEKPAFCIRQPGHYPTGNQSPYRPSLGVVLVSFVSFIVFIAFISFIKTCPFSFTVYDSTINET